MATGKKIRIYEMMDPSLFTQNKAQLKTVLIGNADKKNDIEFNVFNNGFLSFFNLSKLWKKSKRGQLPQTIQEVIAIIINYIYVECLGRYGKIKETLPFFPFPPQTILKMPPSVAGVINPKTGELDHLICWCYCKLYSNSQNESLDVDGAVFEFRIGEDKTVIGLNTRWRPVIRPKEEVDLIELQGVSTDDAGNTFPLIYHLDTSIQPFLSPYYKITDEENSTYKTASRYSLELTILQKNKKNGADIRAQVNGGSGHFRYNWAYWQPDTISMQGIKSLAENVNMVSLGLGVYNIILDVVDLKTGGKGMPQVKRHQQLIYALGIADDKIMKTSGNYPSV